PSWWTPCSASVSIGPRWTKSNGRCCVTWRRAHCAETPTPCAGGSARRGDALHARSSAIAALLFIVFAPAIAWAHERWVHNTLLFPVDRAFFRSMRGDVLRFSLMASLGV